MRTDFGVRFGILVAAISSVICVSPVRSQSVTNSNNTGYPPNAIIQGTEIESVQITNRNLHIEIPIYTSKGRAGLDVTYKFVLDSKGWTFSTQCSQGVCTDHPNTDINSNVVLTLRDPLSTHLNSKGSNLTCGGVHIYDLKSNVIFTETNGTKHHFLPDPVRSASTISPCDGTFSTYSQTLYADDGSGWIVTLNPNFTFNQPIRKDGMAWGKTDSNGNSIAYVSQSALADTLGRALNNDGSYVDTNGSLRSATVVNTTVPLQLLPLCSFSTADACTVTKTSMTAPSSITLPNGLAYTFTYAQDGGGEPLTMTLPSGGQVSWTWGAWDRSGRQVSTRTVSANGVTGTWTYSATTVTDPANNDTRYTYLSVPEGSNGVSYVSKIEYFSGSVAANQILKTVSTDYQLYPWPNGFTIAVPIRKTTTWNGTNQVRKTETDFDILAVNGGTTTWSNPIETREYDWGTGSSGALARRTHFNYLHLQNSTYRTANTSNKPTSKIVYDGSGSTVAQTAYTYDGTTVQSTSATPAPSHDYTNYGSSNNIRGNLTQVSNWVNTSNTWLNTNNTYDDLGNLLSTTDPLNHTTSFNFTDNFTDGVNRNTRAYITTVTLPVTNSIPHIERKQYYLNIGPVAASCGQNFPAASACTNTASIPQPDYAKFTYDLMNRPLNITRGDGGQTNYSYNDATLPLGISSTQSISTGTNLANTVLLDGMGRIKQTQTTSDPQGTVFADITYDALGRKSTVSNPYRSISDATYGITTSIFDALSRITTLIPPDGTASANNVTTSYSGNCVAVTDQAGKARKTCSDGLGRLTQVFEDPAVLNYETDYTYDALDNLLTVNQKGGSTNSANWRTRTFTYDSLSRLICASNPESATAACPATATSSYTTGTIGYAYDANGNLLTKTSLAPNQTGNATVATTYVYDALNRFTQKSYSDGTTPTVKYGYDGVAPSGCTPPTLTIGNPIERRTSMCDGSGASAWSLDLTAGTGWKITEARTTNGVTKNTICQNNFAGSVATLTYPTSRVFTYTYNAAARPLSAIDVTNSVNFATAALYVPSGALSSLKNGASLVQTLYYNSRLQPCRISAKISGNAPTSCTDSANIGTVLDLTYNFNVGISDNGNVAGITNNRGPTRSQTFAYDSLNRIATAQTTSTFATSPANCWGEAFFYDNLTVAGGAWGNLTKIQPVSSAYTGCTQESGLSLTATTKNQISGNTYDAAGNLINDGLGHTYTFNAENQLICAANTAYLYDGDGKRVKKATGCTTPVVSKLYWYGTGSDALAETNASGTASAIYIFFGGRRITRVDVPSQVVHYYFSDHLGSANVVTSSTGGIQDESDYYPFGGERAITNSDPNNYKFTGKERDSESGLDDFDARYYSSSMGRFMSPDWSAVPTPVPYAKFTNPQTLNLYSMVADDPESFVDLDGHADDDIGDQIAHFFVSAGLTFLSDNVFGAFRPSASSPEEHFGQALGDFAAQQSGIAEAELGASLATPALVLAGSGQVEALAVPTGLVAHGTVTAGIGTINLAKDAAETSSSGKSDSSKKDSASKEVKPDTRQTKAEKNTLEGAQEQADSIGKAKEKLNKTGQGEKIRSTKKSEQRLKNQLKKIQSSKDVE